MIAEARPSRRSALARERHIEVPLRVPGAAVARKRAPTRVLSRMHEARA